MDFFKLKKVVSACEYNEYSHTGYNFDSSIDIDREKYDQYLLKNEKEIGKRLLSFYKNNDGFHDFYIRKIIYSSDGDIYKKGGDTLSLILSADIILPSGKEEIYADFEFIFQGVESFFVSKEFIGPFGFRIYISEIGVRTKKLKFFNFLDFSGNEVNITFNTVKIVKRDKK